MNTSSWIASTPGHCATMSSICIWKMSWLILSQNRTHRNRYLSRCVLNVVSSDVCSVRCIPKNAFFPSTLENFVAPDNYVDNLFRSWCFMVFSEYCFVQILWVETNSQLTVVVSLDTSMRLPMVLALFILQVFLDQPCHSTLSRFQLCTGWAPCIFCAGWVVLVDQFEHHIHLTCYRFWSKESWDTGFASPLCCWCLNATWLHIDRVEPGSLYVEPLLIHLAVGPLGLLHWLWNDL